MLRKAIAILISVTAAIALFGEAAHASPGSTDPLPKHKAVPFQIHGKSGLAGAKYSTINATKRALADPPLGGCEYDDVTAEGTAWYTDGILTSAEVTWTADTLCHTTAPGQAMAGIIADSSWWHNGHIVASGRPNSCTNCNSAFSDGSWVGGPSSAGTYWAGGLFIYKLPSGWIWTALPPSCVLFSTSGDTIECSGTSGTLYISPTYP